MPAMKNIILLVAIFLSFTLQAGREYTYERFPFGDEAKRPSPKVYLPTNISEKDSWPLVISLHGFYSTAIFQNAFFNAKKLVTKKGFILVVPYGQKNYLGARFWNASDYCCDFFNQKIDDIKHLKDLISSLKNKYPVGKVFLVGHSNGGFLAHRFACEEDNDISGIVSISGAGVINPASCNPKKGVSILQVHGTKDKVIKFDGRKGKYPSKFRLVMGP
jgi:polyhydroxybutyrate depolymerase